VKICPYCKQVVTFYYDKYRCSYCSVWLDPDEVLSNPLDRPSAPWSADNTLSEAARPVGSRAADQSGGQAPDGQNGSNPQD
jgi:hypothetical protein